MGSFWGLWGKALFQVSLHGLQMTIFSLCLFASTSLYVCCVQISLFIRKPVILDKGPPWGPPFNLITSEKTLSPNKVTFWVHMTYGRDTIKLIKSSRASLVAQCLSIRLPMQGTWVRALVWEDPTCRGATKPMCHNYLACALEPASHSYWVHVSQLLKPMHLQPVLRNKRRHRNKKPVNRNEE